MKFILIVFAMWSYIPMSLAQTEIQNSQIQIQAQCPPSAVENIGKSIAGWGIAVLREPGTFILVASGIKTSGALKDAWYKANQVRQDLLSWGCDVKEPQGIVACSWTRDCAD